MAFQVRDAETDRLVRELAAQEGVGLTDAVKMAVREKLDAARKRQSLLERIRPLQEEFARDPKAGLEADKAFYDSLNDA